MRTQKIIDGVVSALKAVIREVVAQEIEKHLGDEDASEAQVEAFLDEADEALDAYEDKGVFTTGRDDRLAADLENAMSRVRILREVHEEHITVLEDLRSSMK